MSTEPMTIYQLKPRFQQLLRPLAASMARAGVPANAVTIAAAAGSIAVGAVTIWLGDVRSIFLVIPIWFFIRMALNAIDGMLAREFHQQSVLGGYLNEIGDVVADAALYLPIAFVPPFSLGGIGLVILLSTLSEFAGALGPTMGASRRYDGPLGKSDRAVVFGALSLWVGAAAPIPLWMVWTVPIISTLLVLTIVNRIRAGIGEARRAASPRR
jgi:CDP-diacylglycerol--glycerol-3-phosphate 3-phosphatidyltransferase